VNALNKMRTRVSGMWECHEVGRIIQDYLDEDLDSVDASRVARHLEACRRCGMEASAYSRIKESLARVGREGRVHPEDELSIERLRRFAAELSA
jgi:predicted anti-sigma-YlaC factor YlaD